jgi:hypothetical protein
MICCLQIISLALERGGPIALQRYRSLKKLVTMLTFSSH